MTSYESVKQTFKIANLLRPMSEDYKSTVQMPQSAIFTGITAIDEGLQGIMPNDFVVIGATTGVGKTALSCQIASQAATDGKKVALFALEAYDGEISDRIKFPKIADKWFKEKGYPLIYKEWKRGKYNLLGLPEIEDKVIAETPDALKENMYLRYRTKSTYSVDDFLREIRAFAYRSKPDLIVVDHLHYFSLPDDISENKATKRIVNCLRDYGLLENIPIVLFAHMRKKHYSNKSVIPTLDEFHGSSEITKNATVVLTFAPAYDFKMPTQYQFPTYMHICKDRFNGGIKRYVMLASFDIRQGKYEDDYKIFRNKGEGIEPELLENRDIPGWAEHAIRSGYNTCLGSV